MSGVSISSRLIFLPNYLIAQVIFLSPVQWQLPGHLLLIFSTWVRNFLPPIRHLGLVLVDSIVNSRLPRITRAFSRRRLTRT